MIDAINAINPAGYHRLTYRAKRGETFSIMNTKHWPNRNYQREKKMFLLFDEQEMKLNVIVG